MDDVNAKAAARHSVRPLSVLPLEGLPMFAAGMSVAGEVLAAARRQGIEIAADDVIVLAQKIVSKAEGRAVRLGDIAAKTQNAGIGGALGEISLPAAPRRRSAASSADELPEVVNAELAEVNLGRS